jgi:hypothetical protein
MLASLGTVILCALRPCPGVRVIFGLQASGYAVETVRSSPRRPCASATIAHRSPPCSRALFVRSRETASGRHIDGIVDALDRLDAAVAHRARRPRSPERRDTPQGGRAGGGGAAHSVPAGITPLGDVR